MTRTFKKSLILFLIALSASFGFAKQFSFEGYNEVAVDIPDGISDIQVEKDMSGYMITSSVMPVQFIIKFYGAKKYKNQKDALEDSLKKLGASEMESESVQWRNQTSQLGIFSTDSEENPLSGWGLSARIPENKNYVVFIGLCARENAEKCGAFMLSALDSLCIDRDSFYESGAVTAFSVPATGQFVSTKVNIDSKDITLRLDKSDRDASEYLIEREYEVLKLYQTHEEWKGAWQRYYRMIFKDSFKRLQESAFLIFTALESSCKDETELAQKLLTWTQSFKYERETNSSDFSSLPSILLGNGSDCDSRAMLISVLLQNMNIDSILFVSADYSHAIAGLVSDHPGQAIPVGSKKYLTGETTAKNVTWGMISQDQSDFSKWIPVEPPLPLR